MRRSNLSVVMLIAVLAVCECASANLYDGFEDGDTTSSPPWTVTNPAGTHSVVSDPFRTDNLVLEAIGTRTAHRELYTPLYMPTSGFYFEAEYAVSSSADEFSLILALDGESDFLLRTWIKSTAPSSGHTGWLLAQNPHNSSEWLVQDPDYSEIPDQPLDEWWKIALWNEPTTEIVTGEIRKVSDNSLVWTRTVSLPSISSNEYIYGARLAIEEVTGSQYLDNVALRVVPTPSAILLGSIGLGLSGWLCRRKQT